MRVNMKASLVLYVSAYILVKAESGSDNTKCQDAGSMCKAANCDSSSIADRCPMTCGRCNTTGNCVPGQYWNGRSCGMPPEYRGKCSCNTTGRWGVHCEHGCSKWCLGGTCDRLTGECTDCLRNRYTKMCEQTYEKCGNCTDTPSNCHRTTGTCLCGCNPGFYGPKCEGRCNRNCRRKECNSSGICMNGCKEGYFGPRCDKKCGECVDKSCSRTGKCLKGCNRGWHGTDCNSLCSNNCERSNCHQNGTCMECLDGFHGDRCKNNCSAGCATKQCNRDGSCLCRKGYFGHQCRNNCSVNCLNTSCSQTSGQCEHGCVLGWYGATCTTRCPDNCAAGACRSDGSCLSCREGFRGTYCNMSCPQHCVGCDQNVSKCTSCESGYFGNTCGEKCNGCLNGSCNVTDGFCMDGCKPRLYGQECQSNCSRNCLKQNGVSLCSRGSGTCNNGCYSGWYKAECDVPCPLGCKGKSCSRDTGICTDGCTHAMFGPHCNQSCHCLISPCNVTGICTGCQNGYYGPSCSSICPPRCDTCEQYTGACVTCVEGWRGPKCNESYVQSLRQLVRVLSACIGVVIFSGIVIAVIIIRKKCNRSPRGIYLSPVRADQLVSDGISLQEFSENGESEHSHYETIPDDSQAAGYEALSPSTSRTSGYTGLLQSADNARVTED